MFVQTFFCFYFILDWLQINPGCLNISVLKTAIEDFDIMFSITQAHDDHPSEDVYIKLY